MLKFTSREEAIQHLSDFTGSRIVIAASIDNKFFNYEPIAKKMWWDLVKEAQDRTSITFDSENNSGVSQRKVSIDTPEDQREINSGEITNDKMRCDCELKQAGGDWEYPVYYFCCQVYKGGGRSFSKNECFVLIPSMGDGNGHLIPNDKKGSWSSPDSNKDDVEMDDESVCWDSLQEMLIDYKAEVLEERKEKYPDEF